MPGITVIENPPDSDVLDAVLESVSFTSSYKRNDVIDDADRLIATTGYDGYPFDVFELEDATITLEGYLYDVNETETAETVSRIVPLLREGRTDDLAEWVKSRDGDFLISVADHENDETYLINDLFGRLPTYRATIGETMVVTRELKLVRELANALEEGLEPNRLSLAQTLLFGYPLGTRTLYDGVDQLPPGSVLEVGSNETESLHEWRLDQRTNATRSLEQNAKRLKELWVQSCKNRASVTDKTFISLSGGLDSRAVIGGYSHVEGNVISGTSAREDGGNVSEVDVAREVAHALEIPWESYLVNRTEEHREKLLDTTQGMNNLGMSIGLDFTEQVAARHGNPMFITGDGISIPDRKPRQEVDSIADIVKAVTKKHVFSLADVSSLTGVSKRKIVDSIRNRLHSYPETTLDGKHLHFYFRERAINFQNHGEDRTRYQLWSTTPAYSPKFFAESMACPVDQKRGSKLSRAFLTELDPRIVEIDYVNYGTPINSLEYRVKRYAYEWLLDHPKLKKHISSIVGGTPNRSGIDIPRELIYAPNDAGDLEPYLSPTKVQRVTWKNGSYSMHQKNVLLTVVSAITRDSECRRPIDAPQ